MATEEYLFDILEGYRKGMKTGALFINVVESSEDLIRIYFHHGEIYYVSYGSATGQDAVDIIEYYRLKNATFFDGATAPDNVEILKIPTDKVIETMKKAYKKVRVA